MAAFRATLTAFCSEAPPRYAKLCRDVRTLGDYAPHSNLRSFPGGLKLSPPCVASDRPRGSTYSAVLAATDGESLVSKPISRCFRTLQFPIPLKMRNAAFGGARKLMWTLKPSKW